MTDLVDFILNYVIYTLIINDLIITDNGSVLMDRGLAWRAKKTKEKTKKKTRT